MFASWFGNISDLEDQLDATIDISSSVDGITVEIETVRDHLAAALDLAGELVTSPALAGSELELVRQAALAHEEQQLQDPMTAAFTALAQITTPWPKTDPRYPASPADDIAELRRVTAADVRAYYARFAGASHGELTVVGAFDPAQIRAEAEKQLAKWPSKAPYARLAGKVFGVTAQTKSIAIPDKEQTTIAVGFDFAMRDVDPDYPAWLMVTQLLGGDTSSRLWLRLREHEGLSYDVETWTIAGWDDDAASFDGYATVAPKNVAQAKASLLDEIGKLAGGDVDAKDLQRAKDAWLRADDTNLSNDEYVLQMLTLESLKGRTTDFAKQLRAKIAAVTPADVARVAKRDLDVKRLSIVDAGDPGKATK
jgi:zinc protease